VRSERLFCEQLDYKLLYRWFLNMDVDEPSFDHSTFSFNRERLLKHEVAEQFFAAVVSQAKARGLTSDEHFSADGTLIEAWASLKSFRPKDEKPEDREPPDDPGNPTVDFHGEKRSNATHESTTKLARKSNGQTAKLSYSLNGLTEKKNGLLVAMALEQATGTAERDAAVGMLYSLGAPGESPSARTRATTRRASSPTAANSSSRLTSHRTSASADARPSMRAPRRRPATR